MDNVNMVQSPVQWSEYIKIPSLCEESVVIFTLSCRLGYDNSAYLMNHGSLFLCIVFVSVVCEGKLSRDLVSLQYIAYEDM